MEAIAGDHESAMCVRFNLAIAHFRDGSRTFADEPTTAVESDHKSLLSL
jgi:hypothetical protein